MVNRAGLNPKLRTLRVKSRQGNQWIYTPKQIAFIENWLTPSSPTFGNAQQSAIKAGFSKDYSRVITANYTNLEWVREAKRYLRHFTPEHIGQAVQDLAMSATHERDKLKALDMLARMSGMYIERQESNIKISFTNSVPRPEN